MRPLNGNSASRLTAKKTPVARKMVDSALVWNRLVSNPDAGADNSRRAMKEMRSALAVKRA